MTAPRQLLAIVRFGAALLTVAVVAFLVYTVRRDGPAAVAAWHSAHIRWSRIFLATACALGGHAIYVVGWRRLLRDVGVPAPFWQLVRLFLVSNLGRYLPGGKAWQMALVGMMAAEQQLPPTTVAASSLFQGIIGVGVGAILFIATGGAMVGLPVGWVILPFAGVAVLLLMPAAVRALPRVRALIGRRVPEIDSVTEGTIWALVWTSAASWIGWGIALYVLASGLLAAPVASISAYSAAWTGSFLAGIIAIVSPAGLGAREGVMQAVLTRGGVPPGDVLILVGIARAWVTVLDVVPAVTVFLLRARSRRTEVSCAASSRAATNNASG